MITVGVKTLKNKLSEYLRLVAAGETVLVTDRDRVVAQLTAPTAGAPATTFEARWAELIRRGFVIPAKRRLTGEPKGKGVMKLDDILADLREDRDAR